MCTRCGFNFGNHRLIDPSGCTTGGECPQPATWPAPVDVDRSPDNCSRCQIAAYNECNGYNDGDGKKDPRPPTKSATPGLMQLVIR